MKYQEILKQYKWLLYPIGVVVFILLTIRFILGEPGNLISQMSNTQQTIEEKSQIAAALEEKHSALLQIDQTQAEQDLAWLIQAIPPDKQIDVSVNQLRSSVTASQGELLSFTSKIGEVVASGSGEYLMTANFILPNFEALPILLNALNTSLPLLSIRSINYGSSGVYVELGLAWSPIVAHQIRVEEPLPVYAERLNELKSKLANFVPVAPAVAVTEESSQPTEITTNPNPFTPLAN